MDLNLQGISIRTLDVVQPSSLYAELTHSTRIPGHLTVFFWGIGFVYNKFRIHKKFVTYPPAQLRMVPFSRRTHSPMNEYYDSQMAQ